MFSDNQIKLSDETHGEGRVDKKKWTSVQYNDSKNFKTTNDRWPTLMLSIVQYVRID